MASAAAQTSSENYFPEAHALNRGQRIVIFAGLILLCVFIYARVAGFDFINFDDTAYVTENQWVNHGITTGGLHWAFTTFHYFYWQPLTWISHMLDCQIFGLRAGGHHLTSLLLHIANTLLLFLLLVRLTGALWRSAVVSAIFAVHPLRIESVVWIAERKDVLSILFFLIAIWLYLNYVERPSRRRYYAVLAAFAAGLMAKPMVMTLPVLLVLLDWWPLRRRALAEKGPMLVMAVFSSLITSRVTLAVPVAIWNRIANTLVSYMRYLELSVWPDKLAIIYPLRKSIPGSEVALAVVILTVITAFCIWQARGRPYLILGWLWFVLALIPASGFVMQVGPQAMADRFTYLPQIGLAIAIVWGMADLLAKHRAIAGVTSGAAITALAVTSWLHLPVWRDSVSVFSNAVAVTSENPVAQHYLATALETQGRFEDAIPHHAEAVRIQPEYFLAQYCYGLALERTGQFQGAVEHFGQALRYFPDYQDARTHLDHDRKRLTTHERQRIP